MQMEGEAYQGSWGRDAAAQQFLDAGCPDGALDNNSCSALHYAAGEPALALQPLELGVMHATRPTKWLKMSATARLDRLLSSFC